MILSKKFDYDEKILGIEGKYFTTSDNNDFTNNMLNAKIKVKELVNKSDISEFKKNTYLNENIEILATKAELKAEQDKLIKLQIHDLSYFLRRNVLDVDGFQNMLVYQTNILYIRVKKCQRH